MTIDWFPMKIPFPKISTNTYLRQTAKYMLALLQSKVTRPIPTLQYGSDINNAYIKIAKILKQARTKSVLAQPPAAPIPATVPTPPTKPVRDQRVPIEPIRTPPEIPLQENRVKSPSPPPPTDPAATQVPTAHQFSSYPPTKASPYIPMPNPTNRKTYKRPVRPPLNRRHSHHYNTRYGTSTCLLAQSSIPSEYSHHIANVSTKPLTSGKQPSLKTLLNGPDAAKWDRDNANEWVRLLTNRVENNLPPK